MELEQKHYVAGGGLLATGAIAYLLLAGDGSRPTDLAEAQQRMNENAESVVDRVQEVTSSGELTIDPVTGVFYDDPEEGGEMDDESGDDRNVSFDAVNDALSEIGASIDPTTYAPDTQDGSQAPDGGVLPDAGDSQNWGDAPEAEDDDLTERTANSNLSGDDKSMWDRFANQDSTVDEGDSNTHTDSGTPASYNDSGDLGGLESGDSYYRIGDNSNDSNDSDSGSDSSLPVNTVEDEIDFLGGGSSGSSSSSDDSDDEPQGDYDENGEPLISLPDSVVNG